MKMGSIKGIIASSIILLGYWITSKMIFGEKRKLTKKTSGMILFLSIIIGGTTIEKPELALAIAQKSMIPFLVLFLSKEESENKVCDCFIGTFLVYVTMMVSEFVWHTLNIEIIEKIGFKTIFQEGWMELGKEPIIESIVTVGILCFLVSKLQKFYQKLYHTIQEKEKDHISILLMGIVLVISILETDLIRSSQRIDLLMILSLSTVLGIFILYMIQRKMDKENLIGKYKYVLEYAKVNEGILESYRLTAHETQNHLIILDNMIPKSNKKAHDYIATLTEEKTLKKYYFVNDLKNIPITELKGFINYKMMRMINEKIEVQVTVSKEIERSKLGRLKRKEKEDLYNIIGVLLDNAYEGAKESRKKEVILQIYEEGKEVIVMIANTYKGKIEEEKLGKYGYSTKGENHGVGLHLIDTILKKDKRFEKETSLMNPYFIQKIRIK